jgi:hypothetical protein
MHRSTWTWCICDTKITFGNHVKLVPTTHWVNPLPGYPPHLDTHWTTKHVHHMNGNLFRIYRAIPFLYELKAMLDWSCTSTTLYLGEWLKLEDIHSGVFIVACNVNW